MLVLLMLVTLYKIPLDWNRLQKTYGDTKLSTKLLQKGFWWARCLHKSACYYDAKTTRGYGRLHKNLQKSIRQYKKNMIQYDIYGDLS